MKNKTFKNRFFAKLRIAWKKYYAVLFFLPFLFLAIWMTRIEPNLVHTVHYKVELPAGSDEKLDGFTIALLSDFHLDDRTGKMLPEIIGQTQKIQPDVILLTGDFFVNGNTMGKETLFPTLFRQLSAPGGVYAVPGNHDWEIIDATRQAMHSANITLLQNQAVKVSGKNGVSINLIGIDTYNFPEINGVDELQKLLSNAIPNVIMVHDPAYFRFVPDNVLLTVAGHTHGGQITLPFFGPILHFARIPQRWMRGLVQRQNSTLITTSGISNGNGFPLRLCTMPEVVCIQFKCRKNGKN